MATFRQIDDFSPGKTYKLVRDIAARGDGSTLTEARFTVKALTTLPDSMASIAMVVNTIPTASGGCYNYVDNSMAANFVVGANLSRSMKPNETYYYDIQVTLSSGDIYTVETGRLFTLNTITNLP